MKIINMSTGKYKSIKKPQTIITDSNLIAFIGKNGSGKTNFLEAVKANLDLWGPAKNTLIEYKIQVEKVDNFYDYCKKNLSLQFTLVLDNISSSFHNPKIWIKDDFEVKKDIEEWLKKEIPTLNLLIQKLKKFKELVNEKFQSYQESSGGFLELNIDTFERYLNFSDIHSNISKLETLSFTMEDLLSKEHFDSLYSSFNDVIAEVKNLSLFKEFKFIKPNLKMLDKQFVTIKEDAFEKWVKEQNFFFEKELKIINSEIIKYIEFLKENEEIIKKIDLYFENLSSIKNSLNPFRQRVVHFLGNQENILNKDGLGEGLLNSFLRINLGYDEYKNFSDNKEKNVDEIEKARSEFEKFLNDNMPDFEKEQISGFEVDNNLQIFIKESTGDLVPLTQTNQGRKWMLKFEFLKNIIRGDDVLLLDEPGIFLHPSAQKVFFEKLKEISQNNLVIYTTHIPTFIEADGTTIYSILMTDEGSIAEKMDKKYLFEIARDAKIVDKEFFFSNWLITDGFVDRKKWAQRLKTKIKDSKYKQKDFIDVFFANDASVVSKKLRGKGLTIDNIEQACNLLKINPAEIIFGSK